MLERIFEWLAALPPALLYAALAAIAAVENVFPPFPADTIVAFGAFLAARGEASLPGAFLATWIGNVAGAFFMFWLGRRFGPARLRDRFHHMGPAGAEGRIAALYGRYGVMALFLSRFLPGARALVPPVAGALRVPAVTAGLAIALASAVWYGAIAVFAYSVGAHWDVLAQRVANFGRTSGLVALAITAIVVLALYLRRRARS